MHLSSEFVVSYVPKDNYTVNEWPIFTKHRKTKVSHTGLPSYNLGR